MSDSVLMPALGESVTEGTVTRWLKVVGDQVAVDEPLLEVSTDKVDTEIPSPFAGTLTEILVAEDETVDVGTALATIGSADEAGSADQQPAADEHAAPHEAPEPADAADDDAGQQAAQVPQEVTDADADAEPAQEQEQEAVEPQGIAPSGTGQAPSGATQDVTMPALGESVTEGTVTRWLKEVGDDVALDEPLLEVSTDKVDTEIPSPFAGTLVEVLVAEDETVAVGTALARIGASADSSAGGREVGQPGEEQQAAPAEQAQAAAVTAAVPEEPAQQEKPVSEPQGEGEGEAEPRQQAAPAAEPAAQQPPAAGAAGASGYLTPLVRKLAAEKGVDLDALTGTGVGGRIRKEDVLEAAEKAARERAERERAEAERAEQERAEQERAEQERAEQERAEREKAEQAAPASQAPAASRPTPSRDVAASVSPLRGTTEKASRLRQIIASRMVESLQSMAQLTTVVEVDVTRVARLRARAKNDFAAREGVNLTFLPFFVLAATEALKAHPKVNGVLEGNQITYHGEENVGIAVDTERGLVVPVIRGAGDLNLAGIARKIADLATRTRGNKVTPDELSGATFTVTNTGSGGALFDTPIVPAGTSAILGTGAIVKRPVVATDPDGGEYVAVRSMCYLALSYDHRLVDGADASRYLAAVKKRIEEADFESEVGIQA